MGGCKIHQNPVQEGVVLHAFVRHEIEIISRAIDVNEHIITELGDIETEPPKDYKATFHLLSKIF